MFDNNRRAKPHVGRTTVNLTPADVRKEGTSFGLPISADLLTAQGEIESVALQDFALVGEPALCGRVQRTQGFQRGARLALADELRRRAQVVRGQRHEFPAALLDAGLEQAQNGALPPERDVAVGGLAAMTEQNTTRRARRREGARVHPRAPEPHRYRVRALQVAHIKRNFVWPHFAKCDPRSRPAPKPLFGARRCCHRPRRAIV